MRWRVIVTFHSPIRAYLGIKVPPHIKEFRWLWMAKFDAWLWLRPSPFTVSLLGAPDPRIERIYPDVDRHFRGLLG